MKRGRRSSGTMVRITVALAAQSLTWYLSWTCGAVPLRECNMMPKRCPVCGAMAPLHRVHVVSSEGPRARDIGGFVQMCANCHLQMDRASFREIEFELVLADLMRASGRFAEVRLQPDFGGERHGRRLRPDILARAPDGTSVLIECKSFQTISGRRLELALEQLT